MKKIFTKLMLWAVAATALVSCENNFEEQAPVAGLTQTVTLTAEKPTEVRTELIGGVPYWKADDAIGVYTQTVKDADYYKFTNDATGDALTTSFTGTTAVANTLFVFYPYDSCNGISADGAKVLFPATQSPTATSFDGKADIMLAKPVTLDEEGKQLSGLEFARVGAIVKIVLKGDISSLAGQHISSLTMTATSSLVGRAYLDVEKQELGKLYDGESNSVMATYPAASTQYEVNGTNATYVIVYPQVLEAGNTLTITATTEEGYGIKKDIQVPAGGIDLVQGAVTTLNVSLTADHITEPETVEWVDNAYNLVPSTTNLNIGDKVVFVAAASDKAMGTQNSNNRAAVTVTKNDNKTVGIDSDVTIFTVVEGNSEGTFAFQSSEGYICAASSDKNYLRQETTLTANSSWSVNIAEGIATVKAQGSYTHNWLRFNPTNNPPIFSCYATGQTDIAIYKLVGEYVPSAPAITLSIADVIVEHDETSGEATVIATNGDGWAIKAATEDTWVSNLAYSNGKITFTTEPNEGEARTATVTVTATKADYEDVTTTFTITQKAKPAEGGNEGGTTEVVDVLNYAFTGISGSGYKDWSGKTGDSGAVYAGQSNAGVSYIQLRTTNSNSGIVTTTSGGKVRSITITWASNTGDGKTLDVYGKNSPYNSAADLFSSTASTKGTKIGTLTKGQSNTLTITGDYEYIGMRSTSGAIYITELGITWVSGNGGGSTPEPEPTTPKWGTVTAPAEVAAAGGSTSISYSITDATEGKSASATTTADWITNFTYTADKVTFNVAANTGIAREAIVTLSYEGITETKDVTVKQAAGNTGGGEGGNTEVTETLNIAGNTGVMSGSTSISWDSDNFTVTNTKTSSSNAIRTTDTSHYRAYQNSILTFAAKNGKKITKIVLTCESSYVEGIKGISGFTVSGTTATWTGSANEISGTLTKQTRFSKAVVTLE